MSQKVTVKKDYHNSRFDRWFKANIINLPQSLIEKIIRLNKRFFDKITAISFDYAILEKAKEINSISLNISG